MKNFFSEDTTPFSQQRLYGREVCKIYKCPICGGDIDSFIYDLKKYAYKVMHKGKIKYFDTYTCMRKYEKKHKLDKYQSRQKYKQFNV